MKKILCVCLSATYQRTVSFEELNIDEVNRSHHYGLWASGKAVNSARVLEQLEKGCARAVCPLGSLNDAEFLGLAAKDGIVLDYVSVPGKIRECWTLLDKKNQTVTELVVGEPAPEKMPENADIKLLKLVTQNLDECDALLLAGSRQGIWPQDIYAAICGIALDKGKTVLADFIGNDLDLVLKSAVPTIVKINEKEFKATFGLEATPQNIQAKSVEYNNIFVITRGSQSTLAASKGTFYECPVQKVKVVNTIACGDSFNAGFVYEYLKSGDIKKALEKGTECAALNAGLEAPGAIKCL